RQRCGPPVRFVHVAKSRQQERRGARKGIVVSLIDGGALGGSGGFWLRFRHVSKPYGRVRALNILSFNVVEGRFFVLFGPSSVGKTTTLRTIAGLVQPDSGTLLIGGRDMTHAPIAGRGV